MINILFDVEYTVLLSGSIALLVGCVAQLAECQSLAGELPLSCALPAADR